MMMVNNTNQIQAKRKKKFTGGNASKRHRDRVNIEFNNLAKLLPFPENVIAKLDKSSILRLAVSYIRAKSFFKDALPVDQEDSIIDKQDSQSSTEVYKGILEETCLTEFFLQALDGFLIVITEDLKVLYVSESVRDYLGYCQAGIIHESFLQFIHWGDEDNVKNALKFDRTTNGFKETDKKQSKSRNLRLSGEEINGKCEFNGMIGDSNISSRVQSRRFVCRMKCAFSCSSRFYTAFQAFQFSGHVRRSTIQEGKEQRTLNTLIAFGCPSASSKFDPTELVSDTFDESKSSCPDEEANGPNLKMVGLHIEPRLRPHIAPIPILQSETDGRINSQSQTHSFNRHFNMNTRSEHAYNGAFATRIGSPYPRLVNGYFRDGPLRYANGWAGRSSSLSNSPISDASSPRGIKRSMSADASPDTSDVMNARKHTRYDENVFGKNQNGINGLPLDDIHSSARILMQLKETQKKLADNYYGANDTESDSSSDEKSERVTNIPWSSRIETKTQPRNINPMSLDRNFPSVNTGKNFYGTNGFVYDENRRYLPADGLNYNMRELSLLKRSEDGPYVIDRDDVFHGSYRGNEHLGGTIRCRPSPTKHSTQRSFVSNELLPSIAPPSTDSKSVIQPSPRISPLNGIRSSPSRLSPPKKDSNRGFHISTILGLEDEPQKRTVAGQLKEKFGSPVEKTSNDVDLGKEVAREKGLFIENGLKQDQRGNVLLGEDVANIDDVKTSFAHVLQVFTATITRTIDTILKP